jgi:hypothetical protein
MLIEAHVIQEYILQKLAVQMIAILWVLLVLKSDLFMLTKVQYSLKKSQFGLKDACLIALSPSKW